MTSKVASKAGPLGKQLTGPLSEKSIITRGLLSP